MKIVHGPMMLLPFSKFGFGDPKFVRRGGTAKRCPTNSPFWVGLSTIILFPSPLCVASIRMGRRIQTQAYNSAKLRNSKLAGGPRISVEQFA
uniref:Uncharacterized protein n=1 Tax=Physcomitrium patens TaxID=3218 RepID=A0A2K1INE1_PHYPA|nr:hypothetical protein PHYPA_027100 [Physcomitrium patens]